MQIRMLKMFKLQTRRTSTATIFIRTMGAVEILRISEGQLQFPYTGYTGKELRVGNSSLTHRLTQLLFRRFLSYYLGEKQFLSVFQFIFGFYR